MKKLQKEVDDCNNKIVQLSLKLAKQDDDLTHLREELKLLLIELATTRCTLTEIVKKL